MRILIVHQYFLAQGEAGGSRWNELSRYFAQAGHEVTVLAGTVHYATGAKTDRYKGHLFVREEPEPGVTVYRCHVSETYNRSFLGRFWAYLSFALSSTWVGLTKVKRPDVVIATSPPLTVAMTMRFLAACKRAPAIFEVRDLWPESAIDTGVLTSRLLIWLSYRLERMAYRRAKRINVLTPAFRDVLVSKKGIAPEKISVIPNGADPDIVRPGPRDNEVRRSLGLEGKFVICYVGAHGRANRLGQLLDAAEIFRREAADARILFVGDGMEKPGLIRQAKERGLENVIFVDSIPKERIADYINAADVCTAVLMRNDTFKTVYPNKVFDYMSCERPVVIGIDGVARQLVEEAGGGLFAEPENPRMFVDQVLRLKSSPELCRQMGQSGRRYVLEHFDRAKLARRYLELLSSIGDKK